jgi:acetyl-CoA carboxylase biotin carboxyl carrier protein
MDVEQIKALVELMSQNALSEIMIRDGESRIVLRRGALGQPSQAAMPPPQMMMATPAAAPPPPVNPDAGLIEIKAPMVGTFYSASSPDSPPFVRVGSVVDQDTVVCIIEAMKVFNEIKAECSGTIERVMVANSGPVEFGQPLYLVRPHA